MANCYFCVLRMSYFTCTSDDLHKGVIGQLTVSNFLSDCAENERCTEEIISSAGRVW